MNWQPIETAPKDGTWILVTGGTPDDECGPELMRPAVCQWSDQLCGGPHRWRWMHCWFDGGYYGEYDGATHWQPLPEPPA